MVSITGKIGTEHYKTILSNGRNESIGDEPRANNGTDLGFSPGELLCSALATCTCVTLRMYADRKKWNLTEVKVGVSFTRDAEKISAISKKK